MTDDRCAVRVARACRAVEQWLKTAPIQCSEGHARGGIAGCLVGNAPAYLYGEVTGYWLVWASQHAPDRLRITAAVDFLASQWSQDHAPPTRLGAQPDWRNRAVFSFDLAMMIRGLAFAAPITGVDRCADVAVRLGRWLEKMVDEEDGTLGSHVRVVDGEVPDRWSTRKGPYQAKTAAVLLRAPAEWVSRRVLLAAQRTLPPDWQRAAGHPELHPRFYALEGLLLAGRSVSPVAVVESSDRSGRFPEVVGGRLYRSDVSGQALRLLMLCPSRDDALIAAVAEQLLGFIKDDGSVAFIAGDSTVPIWCALFAHQALDWIRARQGESHAVAPTADRLI